MRSAKRSLIALLVLSLLAMLPAAAATSSSKKSSAKSASVKPAGKTTSAKKKKVRRARRGAWKRRGQQAIKEDRAREIQAALIREGYLDGEANGVWDNRTQAAMQKFQADNGWQAKVVPDSRALIKLGLGPDHSNLLNPDTAALPTIVATPAVAVGAPNQD